MPRPDATPWSTAGAPIQLPLILLGRYCRALDKTEAPPPPPPLTEMPTAPTSTYAMPGSRFFRVSAPHRICSCPDAGFLLETQPKPAFSGSRFVVICVSSGNLSHNPNEGSDWGRLLNRTLRQAEFELSTLLIAETHTWKELLPTALRALYLHVSLCSRILAARRTPPPIIDAEEVRFLD